MLESWIKQDQRYVSFSPSYYCSYVLIVSEQLYTATLDNTGNNNTTCKTIEHIHAHHSLKWNSGEQQLPYISFFLFTLVLY